MNKIFQVHYEHHQIYRPDPPSSNTLTTPMDHTRDDKLVFESSEEVSVATSFDKMGLNEDLIRGIYAYNFEKPSAIQQRAIVPITKGRDVIAQSQSGTGKTGSFAISALQAIDTNVRDTQALV